MMKDKSESIGSTGVVPDHELPRSAEEIDIDRLVWDPAYRDAVRHLLTSERPVETVAAGAGASDGPRRRR